LQLTAFGREDYAGWFEAPHTYDPMACLSGVLADGCHHEFRHTTQGKLTACLTRDELDASVAPAATDTASSAGDVASANGVLPTECQCTTVPLSVAGTTDSFVGCGEIHPGTKCPVFRHLFLSSMMRVILSSAADLA
jgi:hypothetical protein